MLCPISWHSTKAACQGLQPRRAVSGDCPVNYLKEMGGCIPKLQTAALKHQPSAVQYAAHYKGVARQGADLELSYLEAFRKVENLKRGICVRTGREAAGSRFGVGGIDGGCKVRQPNRSIPHACLGVRVVKIID